MMVTHDVDEAVLLSDRIVMMTNGPAATIGEVLRAAACRCALPRHRLSLATTPATCNAARRCWSSSTRRHRRTPSLRRPHEGRPARRAVRQMLVMVGNGMAGVRTLEELLKIAPDLYDITVFGAEPHPNYNRILLSPVLAGEQTVDQIVLNPLTGTPSTASRCTPARGHADRPREAHRGGRRRHRGTEGLRPPADRHRLQPFILPVPGKDLPASWPTATSPTRRP